MQSYETIYLGPGQLTMATARALATQKTITIVTNSLEIAHWVATHSDLPVLVTGGRVGVGVRAGGTAQPKAAMNSRSRLESTTTKKELFRE